MGMCPGDYKYLCETGVDFKIYRIEVIGESCNCHPETCCCNSNSYSFYRKEYNDGRSIEVEKTNKGFIDKLKQS
jgi:hypothetical protein